MARKPRPLPKQVVIASDLAAARPVQEAILAEAETLGYSSKNLFALRLGMEEAIVNAHKHGNAGDGHKHITISYEVTPSKVEVRIRDEGAGFNPDCVPDCRKKHRVTMPHGRGVMLMKSFLDRVAFNDCGNEVHLVKKKS